MEPTSELDLREERMNAFTHGAGILFGLVCIPLLVAEAISKGSSAIITGAIVYGVSFLMVFISSTLFHSRSSEKMRNRLKILDHICIYFLIAGTYTPLILIFVRNDFGLRLLYTLWSLTAIGTIFKLFFTGKMEWLSVLIYVGMGWMLFSGGTSFFTNMPAEVVWLIIIGGILYTIGVFFYVKRWFAYHHAVWHVLGLVAAICHFAAIKMSV